MAKRRRHYRSKTDDLGEAIGVLIALLALGGGLKLYQLYLADQTIIWRWVLFAILGLVFVGLAVFLFDLRRRKRKQQLLKEIDQKGLDQTINTFITRFGWERKNTRDWPYRGRYFAWDRLKDFRKSLHDQGLRVSLTKWDDTLFVLKHFIQNKEERFTLDTINAPSYLFAKLDGAAFERLLARLFERMGFAVQMVGGAGDQGADLLIEKSGQRSVVQAKCHRKDLNNKAVQEVIAAQRFYHSDRACIVLTSRLNDSARHLAKEADVYVIEQKQLKELLAQHLHEHWR